MIHEFMRRLREALRPSMDARSAQPPLLLGPGGTARRMVPPVDLPLPILRDFRREALLRAIHHSSNLGDDPLSESHALPRGAFGIPLCGGCPHAFHGPEQCNVPISGIACTCVWTPPPPPPEPPEPTIKELMAEIAQLKRDVAQEATWRIQLAEAVRRTRAELDDAISRSDDALRQTITARVMELGVRLKRCE